MINTAKEWNPKITRCCVFAIVIEGFVEVAGYYGLPESCHEVCPQGEGRMPYRKGVRVRPTAFKTACKA
jgi:hypothetical protein